MGNEWPEPDGRPESDTDIIPIAKLCAELHLLPDVSIAEEARESYCDGGTAIYKSIMTVPARYAVMDDLNLSIELHHSRTQAFLNGDIDVRWKLDNRWSLDRVMSAATPLWFLGEPIPLVLCVEENMRVTETHWEHTINKATPGDPKLTKKTLTHMAAYEGKLDRKDMRFLGPPAWVPPGFPATTLSEPDQGQPRQKRSHLPRVSWSGWTHPSVRQVLERRTQQLLPSWTEAFSLVSEFLAQDHKAIPCLLPPTFMALFGRQYSDSAGDSPPWRVAFNAVLAIAQRRRLETGRPAEEDLVWNFASNALGSMLDVLMRSSCLLFVQALLLTASFFIGTPNPQPSFMLVGSALRMAHSIGLHRNGSDSGCGSIEGEMRGKSFALPWVSITSYAFKQEDLQHTYTLTI
ncbi:hypothetical protein MRS44_017335 [Fusarium solani]|uniref:uncharacterized protein n=1 Tax=Fusarium solani TaxID=169388 RepID=UPI0032C3EE93|nr:hypothetical protein MRS44_017335 [Fusarium solani]